MENYFNELYQVNCSDFTEKKDGLTYLSWAYAIREAKKRFPDLTYEIVRDRYTGLPYVYDENTGYMVFTKVTIGGLTHEMWLPVMDSGNHAMKSVPYEIKTKYKTITVSPATMFDVNKTIMRCLVKNLAMFGLGLYIYAGEDLPDGCEASQGDAGEEITTSSTNPPRETKKRTEGSKTKKNDYGLLADPGLPITDDHWNELVDVSVAKFGEDAAIRFKQITGVSRRQGVKDVDYAGLLLLLEDAPDEGTV